MLKIVPQVFFVLWVFVLFICLFLWPLPCSIQQRDIPEHCNKVHGLLLFLKVLCHGSLVHFVHSAKYASQRASSPGRSGGGAGKGGGTGHWNLNSTSNSPVAPRRLSCQISANHGETERRANIDKHWKAFAKGHDVITNVISTNQHFASTFFDAETKLQALLPFPASPPERPGELARAMERNVNEEI